MSPMVCAFGFRPGPVRTTFTGSASSEFSSPPSQGADMGFQATPKSRSTRLSRLGRPSLVPHLSLSRPHHVTTRVEIEPLPATRCGTYRVPAGPITSPDRDSEWDRTEMCRPGPGWTICEPSATSRGPLRAGCGKAATTLVTSRADTIRNGSRSFLRYSPGLPVTAPHRVTSLRRPDWPSGLRATG